jgi:UDP:flavonoid glycosyltransferase YjiC (YdhE family)
LLPLAQLLALVRGAKAMLTNGGGTLIQAIACHAATVSVPIASDQAGRIARCVGRGLTRTTPLDAEGMTLAAMELLGDAAGIERMRARARALSLQDATLTAIDALVGMLPR